MSLWCTRHRCWVIRASVSDSPDSPGNWSILPLYGLFVCFLSFSPKIFKIFRENFSKFSRKISENFFRENEKTNKNCRFRENWPFFCLNSPGIGVFFVCFSNLKFYIFSTFFLLKHSIAYLPMELCLLWTYGTLFVKCL